MEALTHALPLAFSLAIFGCSGGAGDTETSSQDTGATDETSALDDASPDDGSIDDGSVDETSTPDAIVDGDNEGDETPPACPTPPITDPFVKDRSACTFAKGAKVADTLGIGKAERAAIPLTHLVIVMNENRSFDHYFGNLSKEGQPAAEGIPATYSNKDAAGTVVKPFHLKSTCLERDPPHAWDPYHSKWDTGKMDGYITASDIAGTTNGHYVLGYYTADDLPFYNFLGKTWSISDRYFQSVIGPTWPNRDYLYAATSDGVLNTGERQITVRNIFDALTDAKVGWSIYGDGGSRADCVSVTASSPHHHSFTEFLSDAQNGKLPPVSFLDPSGKQDEHPANDVQGGEAWSRQIYEAAIKSPQWKNLAVIYTYDEGGGIFDHVAPPKACLPDASETKFDHLGPRVPVIIVSPYARPGFVSHKTHSHTSITRLIELLHDLPALTGRDANSDALLDMFDFNCPSMLTPPAGPAAGKGGCP